MRDSRLCHEIWGDGRLGVQAVHSMTERMRPRGPDAGGLWSGDAVVLGHRRLAILDPDDRANQPMVSADGRYAIVFNGEIYNFQEIRRSLELEGIVFRTTSDTEVLLNLFIRKGSRMLTCLRGMFAFAIWDAETGELFLAHDAYGIKPLYYAQTRYGFVFGSQVKAIAASGLTSQELEPAGLAGFYLWGNVPEPWTLLRNVVALRRSFPACEPGWPNPAECWHDIRVHWRGTVGEKSTGSWRHRCHNYWWTGSQSFGGGCACMSFSVWWR